MRWGDHGGDGVAKRCEAEVSEMRVWVCVCLSCDTCWRVRVTLHVTIMMSVEVSWCVCRLP